jgi:Skp family chaperone for outer membrane proteins
MKKLVTLAASAAFSLAASTVFVAPASAQAVGAASIVLIDMEEVINTSNAGKGATTQIQAQAAAMQSRLQALQTGFNGEEEALRKAAEGKTLTQPQLEAKAKDLQTREQAANTEMGGRQRQLQANQNYVVKQISDAAQPIVTAIMKEKGANIALARGVTLQAADSLDITPLVVTRLNAALPSVQVNAPAGAAAPAKSQGR